MMDICGQVKDERGPHIAGVNVDVSIDECLNGGEKRREVGRHDGCESKATTIDKLGMSQERGDILQVPDWQGGLAGVFDPCTCCCLSYCWAVY
jgi:hypothetical protein